MFRLIKLAAYGLVGYALFEFFRGLSSDESRPRPRFAPDQPERKRQSSGPVAGLTGSGQGEVTETQSADGGNARHVVGRGVVPS
jgi:hypothetical protein